MTTSSPQCLHSAGRLEPPKDSLPYEAATEGGTEPSQQNTSSCRTCRGGWLQPVGPKEFLPLFGLRCHSSEPICYTFPSSEHPNPRSSIPPSHSSPSSHSNEELKYSWMRTDELIHPPNVSFVFPFYISKPEQRLESLQIPPNTGKPRNSIPLSLCPASGAPWAEH